MTDARIHEPGLYDMPEAQYHQDPCVEPSLSSGIARTLVHETPRHAWVKHPRLNPAYEPEEKQIFDLGSAAHAMLLGERDKLAVIDYPDYRKDAAKSARDAARAIGKIPVLTHQMAEIQAMAGAARFQLDVHEEAFDAFKDGKPEQTLIWCEGEGEDRIWLRARLDWLPNRRNGVYYDYKSTGMGLGEEDWPKKQLFDGGYDIQHALYRRGIRAVLGVQHPVFRFIVQENTVPHLVACYDLVPEDAANADWKVEWAINLWRWCLKRNRWPGYPRQTMHASAPPWHAKRFEELKLFAKMVEGDGSHLLERMIDWQSPLDRRSAAE